MGRALPTGSGCCLCSREASMECVICLREGNVSNCTFCSPDCFKAHWGQQHRLPEAVKETPPQNQHNQQNSRREAPPRHFTHASQYSTAAHTVVLFAPAAPPAQNMLNYSACNIPAPYENRQHLKFQNKFIEVGGPVKRS